MTPTQSTSGANSTPGGGDQNVAASQATAAEAMAVVAREEEANKKFEKDNKTVRGHMLNHMINGLFDLFVVFCSTKAIWDSLEKKYSGDDEGKKKYVVGKWLQFTMTHDLP